MSIAFVQQIIQLEGPVMTCIRSCISALKELLSQMEKPRWWKTNPSSSNQDIIITNDYEKASGFPDLIGPFLLFNLSDKLQRQTRFQGTSNKVLFCPLAMLLFHRSNEISMSKVYLLNKPDSYAGTMTDEKFHTWFLLFLKTTPIFLFLYIQ